MLCLAALRQVILHPGGIPIPAILPVSKVQEVFDNKGNPLDQPFPRRAKRLLLMSYCGLPRLPQRQRKKCEDIKHVHNLPPGPLSGDSPAQYREMHLVL